jgi:hypothetical protein
MDGIAIALTLITAFKESSFLEKRNIRMDLAMVYMLEIMPTYNCLFNHRQQVIVIDANVAAYLKTLPTANGRPWQVPSQANTSAKSARNASSFKFSIFLNVYES